MCYDVKQNMPCDKTCYVTYVWRLTRCAMTLSKSAMWLTCGDRQNVLYDQNVIFWQNVFFKTKCILGKICYLKQNVFYDHNVVFEIKCVLCKMCYLKQNMFCDQNVGFWNKMCFMQNVLFKTKCVYEMCYVNFCVGNTVLLFMGF